MVPPPPSTTTVFHDPKKTPSKTSPAQAIDRLIDNKPMLAFPATRVKYLQGKGQIEHHHHRFFTASAPPPLDAVGGREGGARESSPSCHGQ